MSLNQRIKEARLKMGYTQKQLGNLIGVAKTTVAGYEKNREPDAATIGLIIDALNVDANFLFQDEMKALAAKDFTIPEIRMVKKYRVLDAHGKKIVDMVLDEEYSRCESTENSLHLMPAAAHEISGSSDEDKRFDDEIMQSDNF